MNRLRLKFILQNRVLGIVLLKLYATTGRSTPDARLKSLILTTGVTYRNHFPIVRSIIQRIKKKKKYLYNLPD